MRIWLDDVRAAPDGWYWLKTAEEAIAHFNIDAWFGDRHKDCVRAITDISLDHDLGENKKTGYDVVKFIEQMVVEKGYLPPNMTIHSQNPVGRENMQRAIDAIMVRTKSPRQTAK